MMQYPTLHQRARYSNIGLGNLLESDSHSPEVQYNTMHSLAVSTVEGQNFASQTAAHVLLFLKRSMLTAILAVK